jgi:hypothetical protein
MLEWCRKRNEKFVVMQGAGGTLVKALLSQKLRAGKNLAQNRVKFVRRFVCKVFYSFLKL